MLGVRFMVLYWAKAKELNQALDQDNALAHYATGAISDIKQLSYIYTYQNYIYCFNYILGTRHAIDIIIGLL